MVDALKKTRRTLTELIVEASDDILKDQPKGKDIAWLFNHPNGSALLDRYIQKLYVYCPENSSWLQVKWVAPRNAYDFYLSSPKKPPYNKTKLNVAEVYCCKRMSLAYPRDNLIYTGEYAGSWPAERFFCDAWTVLEASGSGKERRHEHSWKTSSKAESDQPGPSGAAAQKPKPSEKRPQVHCSCGKPMRCEACD